MAFLRLLIFLKWALPRKRGGGSEAEKINHQLNDKRQKLWYDRPKDKGQRSPGKEGHPMRATQTGFLCKTAAGSYWYQEAGYFYVRSMQNRRQRAAAPSGTAGR